MNTRRMIPIDGADDITECFHLFPHRSQTVDSMQDVDYGYVRQWVHLFHTRTKKKNNCINLNEQRRGG